MTDRLQYLGQGMIDGKPHHLFEKANPNHDELGRFATGDSARAISNYVAGHADTINAYLRANTPRQQLRAREEAAADQEAFGLDLMQHIDLLTRATDHATLPEDTVLYRGVAPDVPIPPVGSTIIDRGFVSTTRDEQEAKEFGAVVWRINAPAGTHGLDLSKVNANESEVLLQRGTTFKVTAVHPKNSTGEIYVDMDVRRPGEGFGKANPNHDELGRFSESPGPLTIRLGQRAGEAMDDPKPLLAEVEANWPRNPLNPRQFVFQADKGAALFELGQSMDGGVHVSWMQAYPNDKGIGSKALQALTDLADKHGTRLDLDIWDRGGRAKDLVRFYRRFGFKRTSPTSGGADMVRLPNKVEKYNPYHRPAGPGGGQFTSAPGGAIGVVNGNMVGYEATPVTSATELFNKSYDPNVTVDDVLNAVPGARELAEQAEEKTAAGVQSQTANMDANGHYTPERTAVHEAILDQIFTPENIARAKPPEGEQPTLVVLGGRGGSGKSYFTENEESPIDASKYLVINSDDIKAALPGYEGWNAGLLHEESSDVTSRAVSIARQAGLNVVYDATLRSTGTISRMVDEYSKSGYKVEGYYMHAAPQVAAVRAARRFVSKGRYVPPAYVLSSLTNEKTFDALMPKMSKWAIYDNNGGGGPKRVAGSD